MQQMQQNLGMGGNIIDKNSPEQIPVSRENRADPSSYFQISASQDCGVRISIKYWSPQTSRA